MVSTTLSDYLQSGFTVVLVERGEGVETKPIKTSYVRVVTMRISSLLIGLIQSPTAGTAYVTFENVKVPVENTLGPEGGGIFVILR
jgi:alkylation response protein AidB-like acyl-CoA dehydrogenase